MFSVATKLIIFSVVVRQRPTKLDRDVYLALGDTAIDRHKYPHVHRWKSLVTSYSAQDQKRCVLIAANAGSQYLILGNFHEPYKLFDFYV